MSEGLTSMTGFGSAVEENDRYRIGVEIRSVNHRGLDLVVRLRDPYRRNEVALRDLVKSRLRRGRVEVSVDVERIVELEASVDIDRRRAQALVELVAGLRAEGLELAPLSAGDLLRIPGILEIREAEASWSRADEKLLIEVSSIALDELQDARGIEGAKLAKELQAGFDQLAGIVEELTRRRQEVAEHQLGALEERLHALVVEALPDRQRLLQEVALLVERGDVREELDRLRAHLEHGAEIMSNPPPVGKRLDFLCQELMRELNTIGAKCRDLSMAQAVLDARLVADQLREQVQNVQ